MCSSDSEKDIVEFEGVIISFESLNNYEKPLLYVQGSVDGEAFAFYLKVSDDVYREYVVKGVGQIVKGRGRILSRDPMVLELVKLGDES